MITPIPLLPSWAERIEKGICRPISRLNFRHVIRGDTFFILGSGPSVNLLQPRHFTQMVRETTAGFNFWMKHDFTPSFYVFEPPDEQRDKDMLERTMSMRGPNYLGVPIIVKDADCRDLDFRILPRYLAESLYVSREYMVKGDCKKSLGQSLSDIRSVGAFIPCDYVHAVPRRRATVAYLVMLGTILGFKKIVLVGLDLKTRNRFFEAANPIIHETADPTEGITVQTVISAINDHVCKPEGVRLMVENKNSLLASELETFQWEAN